MHVYCWQTDSIPETCEWGVESPFTSFWNAVCINVFLLPNQARNVIEDHGTKAMAELFGGKSTDSLASLRYNLFSKKIVTAKSLVTPDCLPPPDSSTKYHCQRVYFQIMVWIGKVGDMNTVDWGCQLVNNRFLQVMTNKTAAPEIYIYINIIKNSFKKYNQNTQKKGLAVLSLHVAALF